jgi:hypothetical protein
MISSSHINTIKRQVISKIFCPYKISKQIGSVAYPLEPPSDICIHNVFHVSLLKKYRGLPLSTPPPPTMHEGAAVPEPKI